MDCHSKHYKYLCIRIINEIKPLTSRRSLQLSGSTSDLKLFTPTPYTNEINGHRFLTNYEFNFYKVKLLHRVPLSSEFSRPLNYIRIRNIRIISAARKYHTPDPPGELKLVVKIFCYSSCNHNYNLS